MSKPVIGVAGMTHLGLVSAAAAAARGFEIVGFDPDGSLIQRLDAVDLPVVEPDLPELLARVKDRLSFTDKARDLAPCDVVTVAPDVATDHSGRSDLSGLERLLDLVDPHMGSDSVEVILSQVPPGFTRSHGRRGRSLFYQVETLVFGEAVERALNPQRIIIGCADPKAELPGSLRAYLEAFDCPILPMGYESAELAKIAINCCLVAQISVANTLAELCEKIGADWSEITPALKLDRRIGQHATLSPGLGIAGGNLERDLATVQRLAEAHDTDSGVVRAWVANSAHRKDWAHRVLKGEILDRNPDAKIAVWGLAYKENTHSTKNSPSLALLGQLDAKNVTVFDPVVPAEAGGGPLTGAADAIGAATGADVLLIMTPWREFKEILPATVAEAMNGRTVIDPYGVLDGIAARDAGLDYFTLGRPPLKGGA